MKNVFHEIHRRALWQVLGIYLAASWIVLQVVDVLADNVALPEWVFPVALVLLLIGLPVVLATAFVQGGVRARTGAAPAVGQPVPEASTGADHAAGAADVPPSVTDDATRDKRAPGPIRAAVEPQGSARSGWKFLTWRNAIAGGVGAFALLAVGTGGWLTMRALGIGPAGTLVAKGLVGEQARVVIADFHSSSGDSSLARTVTEAFRIDFAESPVVRVVDAGQVTEALGRMERDPDTPLDPELARELAQREGFAIVIAGEVGAAGSDYLISARVISAQDGAVLVSHRETADDEGLLSAIDALSKRLRERIGESLTSLADSPPLERVTTSSYTALQRYTEAERAITIEGNRARSIALLEEAIALDSTFAMAHRKLGIALFIRDEERERQIESFTRAFELRDRLSDHERYITEGTYYTYATGELSKAVTAYENALSIDPESSTALTNLGLVYDALGDHESAWDLYRRNIEADSSRTNPYITGAFSLALMGRVDEARALHDEFATRFPDNPGVHSWGAWLYAFLRDYDTADEHGLTILREEVGSPGRQAEANLVLGATAAARGRVAEARGRVDRLREISIERGLPGEVWDASIELAGLDLWVRRDPQSAVAVLDAALAATPLDGVTPYERPYWALATTYAAAGRLAMARRYMDALEDEVWPLARGDLEVRWRYRFARGALAVAEGDPERAVEEYRAIDEGFCPPCRDYALATGFEAASEPDSARAYYRRFADEPGSATELMDRFFLAHSLERLGQLADEAGDLESAAAAYARFVELWADADEEFQPRVRAAQSRLEEIVAERG